MVKRNLLLVMCLLTCLSIGCGDDDNGGDSSIDDDASVEEGVDATIGEDGAVEDAEPNLPGCEIFSFVPDPPEAGAGFQVSVKSPEGYTNVNLELNGAGNPSAEFVSSDTEGDNFVWTFGVIGHEDGPLTMTFTAVNGAANVARCTYNIGGDNPTPIPDAGVDASLPDMSVPDGNVPDGSVPDGDVPATGAFLEAGGLIVMEVESSAIANGWERETNFNGYTGQSYYTWKGGDQFNIRNAGMGVLTYNFQVSDAGEYNFRIRNRHDRADATMDNDCWVRMDGGTWVKVFSSRRGEWVWNSNHEFSSSNKQPAKYQLSAGNHTLEISGRSQNFSIDRLHLYKPGTANAEDESQPESMRSN